MNYSQPHNLKRINITLPETTLIMVDSIVDHGARSRFIDHAIQFYTDTIGKRNLRKALKEGALFHKNRDLHLTEEWFSLDNEI